MLCSWAAFDAYAWRLLEGYARSITRPGQLLEPLPVSCKTAYRARFGHDQHQTETPSQLLVLACLLQSLGLFLRSSRSTAEACQTLERPIGGLLRMLTLERSGRCRITKHANETEMGHKKQVNPAWDGAREMWYTRAEGIDYTSDV